MNGFFFFFNAFSKIYVFALFCVHRLKCVHKIEAKLYNFY